MSKITVPIGPQHPLLKEPLAFALTLEGEHVITVGQGIGDRGLPRTAPGRRVDEDRVLRLEHPLDFSQELPRKGLELRTPVVDRGPRHRAEDAVRNIRGPRKLQEMSSAAIGH